MGAAYQKAGNYREAINAYRRALSLNPQSQTILSNLQKAIGLAEDAGPHKQPSR
jgi:Flp pilus assembly protein TadD